MHIKLLQNVYNTFVLLAVCQVEMVFCYQNCSSDRETLSKFEAECQEFENFLRSLAQFIQTVKGQNNFW